MAQARRIAAGSVLATATPLAVAGAGTSAAATDSEWEMHAGIHGSSSYAHMWAHSDYHRSGGRREVEVTLNNAPLHLRQRNVVAYANLTRVGAIWVTRSGHAGRHWQTSHGQYVPWTGAGSPMRIRTAAGVLGSSGRYHAESDHSEMITGRFGIAFDEGDAP